MRCSLVFAICISTTAFAMPNPDPRFRSGANHHVGDPRFRSGANHHVGDDSFVARFDRAPTDRDTERVRMRVHLEHVRALLAARPATAPELAERRATLLGYLDDYIAKGVTPE